MKYQLRLVALLPVLLLVGLVGGRAALAHGTSEAAAIAAINKTWLAMVASNNAEGIGNLYTADGVFMMSNAAIVTGPKAIAGAWAGLMKLPGVSMTFKTSQLDISKSGDLASDRGTYALAFDGENGRIRDVGKYVVVWKKVAGKWMVAADIFNTDLKAQ